MPDINVKDLDALREFHRHLVGFNQTMDEEFRSFSAHLARIGDVWNDPMHQRLTDSLEEAFRGIQAYLRVAPEPDAYLDSLIRELEEILNRFGR